MRRWLWGIGLAAGLAMATGGLPAGAQDLSGHGGPVSALASDGTRLVSGGFDGRAIHWDPTGQRALSVVRFHDGNVTAVALLPDGRFVTAGQDGRIAVWDDAARQPLFQTERGTSPISALAVAPSGAVIAAGAWTGRVTRIDLATGATVSEQAHADRVTGLAFLPSGDLVSVGADLRFNRLDNQLGQKARAGLADIPNGLAVVGDRLAVVFAEGAVRLLSADGAPQPERFLTERPLIAVAARGDTVAASAIDGSIWLLEATTLQRRAQIAGARGPVWGLALWQDALFAAGMDGTIRRYAARDGRALGQATAAAAGDVHDGSRGAEVFRACAICHSLAPGDHSRAGPSLHGVFDRRIGSAPGYDFSPALRAMTIVWTPRTVSELFEVGPEIYTPGSRMPDQKVTDPADRAALIEFLGRFRP
jgi:cytochrome c